MCFKNLFIQKNAKFLTALAVFFVSCHSTFDSEPIFLLAEQSELTYDEIVSFYYTEKSDDIIGNNSSPFFSITSKSYPCPQVSVSRINSGSKKITVDFDDGCSWFFQNSWNKKEKIKGIIVIERTDNFDFEGAYKKQTFENFYIDEMNLRAVKMSQITDIDSFSNRTIHSQVSKTIVFKDLKRSPIRSLSFLSYQWYRRRKLYVPSRNKICKKFER